MNTYVTGLPDPLVYYCFTFSEKPRFSLFRWVSILSPQQSLKNRNFKQNHKIENFPHFFPFSNDVINIVSSNSVCNCVTNKMLEFDWFLTAPNYGLFCCFRSKLSELIWPLRLQTFVIGQLVKQPIKIKHFMLRANKL